MSDGQAVEFDSPLSLLHKRKSQLSLMVNKTGAEASNRLYQMAMEAERKRNMEPSRHQSDTLVGFVTEV